MYYLYKRMMEEAVEEFRCLSEAEKERDIYLHKHKYLGWLLEKVLTIYFKWFSLMLIAANIVCFIIFSAGNSFQFKWVQIFSIALLLFTVIFCVISSCINSKFKDDKQSAQNFISNTISNIYLDNSKVVNWQKIKDTNEKFYQYLRSDECNKKAFGTTLDTAEILQDSKIKIVWMITTSINTGNRNGYAVLKKGNWIYDTNLKRTYSFKDYIKCRQAEVFKEFSLNEGKYFTEDSYKFAWEEFVTWCEERGA